jgi:transcription elongation factor Elf1
MKAVKYKDLDKGLCPFCDDEDINWEDPFVEDTSAYQVCKCGACGKKWEDRYEMVSYLEIIKEEL